MHASQIQGCVLEQRVEKKRKIAESVWVHNAVTVRTGKVYNVVKHDGVLVLHLQHSSEPQRHECPLSATMIRYDSVYLTCSKKLTGSQLSLPHGINKKN